MIEERCNDAFCFLCPPTFPLGLSNLSIRLQVVAANQEIHEFVDQIACCIRCDLGLVIRWAHFYQIKSDKVQPFQSSQNPPQLSGAPTCGFQRACARSKARIERINIDTEIDGHGANTRPDVLDDSRNAKVVNVIGGDDVEADRCVVLNVVVGAESCTDAGVNGLIACDKSFERSLPEKGAVLDLVLARWRACR